MNETAVGSDSRALQAEGRRFDPCHVHQFDFRFSIHLLRAPIAALLSQLFGAIDRAGLPEIGLIGVAHEVTTYVRDYPAAPNSGSDRVFQGLRKMDGHSNLQLRCRNTARSSLRRDKSPRCGWGLLENAAAAGLR